MKSTPSIAVDQVVLIDEADNQVGVMDKIEAHRGVGQRHRAASVYLFNDQGELLIQQRSSIKIVGAGQWANTCCGNVWPNESYEECAQRRLKNELGILDVPLASISTFSYHQQCNSEFSEWEIIHIFGGRFSKQPQPSEAWRTAGELSPNPAEVSETSWVNWAELCQKIEQGEAGQFGELELELNKVRYTFASWFVLMVQDQGLRRALEKWSTNS